MDTRGSRGWYTGKTHKLYCAVYSPGGTYIKSARGAGSEFRIHVSRKKSVYDCEGGKLLPLPSLGPWTVNDRYARGALCTGSDFLKDSRAVLGELATNTRSPWSLYSNRQPGNMLLVTL